MNGPLETPTAAPATAKLSKEFPLAYLALDPVHVGSGGYRLGRVDLTIVREPGTRLPKLPGTSLSGAARCYAAMAYGKPEAAGQHKDFRGDSAACPILRTFGTAREENKESAGTVSISDARLLLLPVSSSLGPVWVTTADLLAEAGFEKNTLVAADRESIATTFPLGSAANPITRLNLGWMLFQKIASGLPGTPRKGSAAALVLKHCADLLARLVVVHQDVFAAIVNSNLEVRTSVSIDPNTGAAAEGALFSYEAIPRLSVFTGDVVEDDFREGRFKKVDRKYRRPANMKDPKDQGEEIAGDQLAPAWERPAHVVAAGMRLFESLGVGGMGTRGFGRLRAFWPEKD